MPARLVHHFTAFRVAAAYALVGALYILTSDHMLAAISGDYQQYQSYQTFKGWAFIAVTSFALWAVLRGTLSQLEQSLDAVSLAEDRLRGALDAAGGCDWETAIGPDGDLTIRASGFLARTVGFPEGVVMPASALRALIHPDDVESYDAHMALHREVFAGKLVAIPPQTHRIRGQSGEYRWIKVVTDVESSRRDPGGKLFGFALDVHEQQEAIRGLADVIAGGEVGTWRHDLRSNRLFVNDRWAAILGRKLEDLPAPLMIDDWRALVHPDDVVRLNTAQEPKFRSRDYFFTEEFRMRHADGHWVWILSRGRAVEVSESGEALVLSGVHVDISRRKDLEAELIAKSDFLQRLTETSVSGILAFDPSGVIVFANMEAEQILDVTGAGLVGRNHTALGRLYGARDRGTGTGFPFERVGRGGETLHDLRLTLPNADGSERVISVNAAPMESRGGPVQVVCSVSDITQRLNDERRLAQAAEEASHAATHDALTGLPNRESFRAQVAPAQARARGTGELLQQVFLSIDQFQQIKDRFGPQLGDRVICKVAERLEALREPDQLLARVGAEEFTFLRRCRIAEEPERATRALAAAFAKPFEIDGQPLYLSASMGLSLFPMDAQTPEEMWLNADLAMYEAKALGGNRAVPFTPKLRDRLAREAMIGQSLQRAIRDGAFALYLQPKVSLLEEGRLAGAEALVRCTDPALAGIGPDIFMPIAERSGLVRDIDLLMIDLVGAFLAELRGRGQHLGISINLSPESLRRVRFGDAVLAHLSAAQLGPEDVLFEITEGAVVDLNSDARDSIEALLVAGYELSADDFGTGYSSLSYLQKLQLKELKIDRSFVSRISLDDGASDAIVRATLAMAAALGLRTVAEGIDTPAQVVWLRQHGCDLGQGYHFGKPLPAKEFIATFLGPDGVRWSDVALG
ncbi:PAS domain S-box-containing protein/diguanylate cyclase (GGDEF)-like protein [Rhodobacter viridis]|uniref:PAS domain S-box-containing protein/diguanylate cyclase (GGDEF)-like protein n=1 Tax=Rhodobacter viridis TaxID=1054202 RepID=A0A318TZF9_9RHOB|nr:GGDEF domain-containing phosphodiesterase [Rhodobacter viridis]PYF10353.1 PAS domain S-box-containing protein/diguanylate cyclase (GGDEF)-like protein [Rhodobacter viridis]